MTQVSDPSSIAPSAVHRPNVWATAPEVAKAHAAKYHEWIQEHLGVGPEGWDWINIEYAELGWGEAIRAQAAGIPLPTRDSRAIQLQNALASSIHHPDSMRTLTLDVVREGRAIVGAKWYSQHSDACIKLTFKNSDLAGIFLSFQLLVSPAESHLRQGAYLIVPHTGHDALAALTLEALQQVSLRESQFYTWDGGHFKGALVKDRSWDSIIVDDRVIELVKRDTEAFFKRKDWFASNQLAWSRGYLFHGPPGNGKTSTIKALMSAHQLDAHTLSLYSEKASDAALEEVFDHVARNSPGIVVLEDLDRAFPKTGQSRTKVSLQCLLNCLDGLGTKDGVITIATANEPTALDKAILKRPGRFDRTVYFDNPDERLRLRYLLMKAPALAAVDLARVIEESSGFSYAQMQETYILAGQSAYERGSELVDVMDLERGVVQLRTATNLTGKKDGAVGFGTRGRHESLD